MTFLEDKNLFSENQFGFRENLGTTLAILTLINKVVTGFNENKKTLGALCRFWTVLLPPYLRGRSTFFSRNAGTKIKIQLVLQCLILPSSWQDTCLVTSATRATNNKEPTSETRETENMVQVIVVFTLHQIVVWRTTVDKKPTKYQKHTTIQKIT